MCFLSIFFTGPGIGKYGYPTSVMLRADTLKVQPFTSNGQQCYYKELQGVTNQFSFPRISLLLEYRYSCTNVPYNC